MALTQEEYEEVKKKDPLIRKHAHQFLEYGEGYWTSDTFMVQFREAVMIAKVKYPKGGRMEGRLDIFDHSSCHAAMPEDALDASKINPGGKQQVIRDGWWNGKPQKMNYSLGVPKGM